MSDWYDYLYQRYYWSSLVVFLLMGFILGYLTSMFVTGGLC